MQAKALMKIVIIKFELRLLNKYPYGKMLNLASDPIEHYTCSTLQKKQYYVLPGNGNSHAQARVN